MSPVVNDAIKEKLLITGVFCCIFLGHSGRGGATWRPSVTPTGSLPSPSPSLPGNVTPVTRTSLAATPQEMKPIGSGHNTAAKPFAAVSLGDDVV